MNKHERMIEAAPKMLELLKLCQQYFELLDGLGATEQLNRNIKEAERLLSDFLFAIEGNEP